MKELLYMTQKSLRDKVGSCVQREVCEIEPVNKWINSRRESGMEGIRLERKVRDWTANGRRDLGRP
jgi:hypothetical protein